MGKRLLEYDPLTGITTYVDYVPETDTTAVYREQEGASIQAILDANKAMQNDPDLWRKGVKNSWAQYAHIPAIVLEKWLNEHGVDAFKKENWEKGGSVWKLLNSPEYRYLKTTAKYHAG